MIQTTNVTECPKCGEKEIGVGKHSGYAAMYPDNKMSLGSDVKYLICTECGFIIESYVSKPHKFKGTLWQLKS
ncbi:transcription initiation factor TFIIIB [Cytobacillus sp. FJAT-54145]|uniref:Transcription initiation factor TFIIIB n=1 Tax=Cytobacillus spartinae TaxID=3299023 RepID=A0ABW6KGN1_9BACI